MTTDDITISFTKMYQSFESKNLTYLKILRSMIDQIIEDKERELLIKREQNDDDNNI